MKQIPCVHGIASIFCCVKCEAVNTLPPHIRALLRELYPHPLTLAFRDFERATERCAVGVSAFSAAFANAVKLLDSETR